MSLVVTTLPALAQRLVILPVENLGELPGASSWIEPLVAARASEKGWQTVSGTEIERWLAAARIRRMDALAGGSREALLAEFGADAYLATTIFSFRTGTVPVLTVGVRVVDTGGAERFNEVVGLSTEDIRNPLDTRPGDDVALLSRRVLEKLFDDFPPAGRSSKQRRPEGAPVKLRPPVTFLSAQLDTMEPPRRVAVLPFRSFEGDREASRIATQLAVRWMYRAPGFDPVDPADLREALAAEGVRDGTRIWPETLRAIGKRVGASLFLQGNVFHWRQESDGGSEQRTPEVELNLTLVDADSSRVVWSAQHQRRGTQYRGFLRLGAITNVVALADRVLSEMVAAQASARPVSVPAARSPLVPPVGVFTKGTEEP